MRQNSWCIFGVLVAITLVRSVSSPFERNNGVPSPQLKKIKREMYSIKLSIGNPNFVRQTFVRPPYLFADQNSFSWGTKFNCENFPANEISWRTKCEFLAEQKSDEHNSVRMFITYSHFNVLEFFSCLLSDSCLSFIISFSSALHFLFNWFYRHTIIDDIGGKLLSEWKTKWEKPVCFYSCWFFAPTPLFSLSWIQWQWKISL